jgi:hypothetical protein
LRVLFFLRHGGYVRNFDSLIEELAERGHEVHAALGHSRMRWLDGRTQPIVPLAQRHPAVTYGPIPEISHPLQRQADGVRGVLDWLRYLGPEYAAAPKLRSRVAERLPSALRSALLAAGASRPGGNAALRRMIGAAERALPWSPAIDAYIAEQRPDVVCVTPLVDLGNAQADVLRSARRQGIPSVLCVASWDNLTNKGLIRGEPDLVTVWNEHQREEAVRLHRQSPDRVFATGAQSYDHWFAWKPQRDREAFCAEVGLDARRPFLLFLGSSPFIAPSEVPFVRRWIWALRRAPDPAVRDLGVLVRPHPQNGPQWADTDISDLGQIAVWPRSGADPVDRSSREDFHDSIHYCHAVVGINTSALIESAIVGRPVFTVLDDDFADTQGGTLHFAHLQQAGGGLLKEAATLDEHVAQIGASLRGDDGFQDRNDRFLEAFVRPHGLARPAAPILADAIERAAREGLPAQRPVAPAQRVAKPAWQVLSRVAAVVAPVLQARARRREQRRRAERKAAMHVKKSQGQAQSVTVTAESKT